MKNINKIYTLLLFSFLHLSSIFSQTTLVSPSDDISDGLDYCDPVFIDASNMVLTSGFDVEFVSEPAGFIVMTDGFTAMATASNYFSAAITSCLTAVDETDILVEKINTYPNPFSDYFSLELTLKEVAIVDFRLLDETGKVLKILQRPTALSAGNQTLRFSTSDVPAGIYFYELQVDGQRRSGKLTCIR